MVETKDDGKDLLAIYQKTLLTTLDLLRTDENVFFHDKIDKLKNIFKSGDAISLENVEEIIRSIRNITIRELNKNKDDEKSSSSFSFFGKKKKSIECSQSDKELEQDLLTQLKKTSNHIINDLKGYIDKDTVNKLKEFEKNIKDAYSVKDYLSIRENIPSLIQSYIYRVNEDRLQAASIIQEIGARFALVEGHILDSLKNVNITYEDNNEFNTVLHTQMEEMRNSVNFSKTLSELKGLIVSRLSVIESAIDNKHNEDLKRKSDTDKRMSTLEQELNQMKKEIAQSKERTKLLEQEILTDQLTGTNNRRSYDKKIEDEFQRFLRHKHIFSILVFDIDHFKKINDQYGHVIGDKCLQEIVKKVQPVVRKIDFLARYGGEEFVVILTDTEIKAAMEAAEKVRQTVENIIFKHKNEIVKITISIGVTQVNPSDQNIETVFKRADKALYSAKDSGRNRVISL